jgi:glutamate N-acetyltransferase/amino-acid N-acetyltransferase
MEGKDTVRAILCNAGQANAATGKQGWADTLAAVEALSKELGIPTDDILMESTGVIGKRIKMVRACAPPVLQRHQCTTGSMCASRRSEPSATENGP